MEEPQIITREERLKRKMENQKNPEYYDSLSVASKETLEYQGGKMTKSEALHFERHPLFKLSLKMREYDEKAKIENLPIPNIIIYKQIAKRLL